MIRPGEPARLLEGRGGKMNPKLLILLGLSVCSVLSADVRARDYSAPGSYPVGVRTVVLVDKSRKDEYCLLYTSPSPRDKRQSRMPSSA